MNVCSKLKILPVLLLCAASSGCVFFPSPEPAPPAREYSPVEQFIISRTPGSPNAMGTVSDPAFGDSLRIVLEQEYLSAAGETCRRASLFSPRGEAEMVVMCREASGSWVMAPRVWGIGLPPAAPQPPAASPAETPGRGEPEGASSAAPSPGI